MRLGGSTITFSRLSGEQSARALAALGFRTIDVVTFFGHVDLDDPDLSASRALAATVEDLEIEINALLFPFAYTDLADAERYSRCAASAAALLGARSLVVGAGQGFTGDRARDLDHWRRSLEIQDSVAADHGVRLAVEAPHLGTLTESGDQIPEALALIESVSGDIGLDVDTSHVQNCGLPMAEVLDLYAGRIRHVALRDTTGPGQWSMPIGEGAVDFRTFLAHLRITGFDGDLMLELEPDDITIDARLSLIGTARNYIRGELASIGWMEGQ